MSQPPKRIAHHPRDVAACISAYLQEGDMAGIVSMFHPDCQIFLPPDQPAKVGPDGIRAAFADLLEARPQVKSEVTSEAIAGDVAMLCTHWHAVTADGTVIAEGRATEILKKLDHGGWGYLIDCPFGPPVALQ